MESNWKTPIVGKNGCYLQAIFTHSYMCQCGCIGIDRKWRLCTRARPSIDVSREARRRIHIAAAKRDKSIREYVWEAVEARLKHDLVDELSAADLVALNERADPVLAALWNNPKDAAYDKL
jgi:hypothetical protein